MAFPETYSGMRVEAFVSNQWISLVDTSDVRYAGNVVITRGRNDGQSRVSHSICNFVIDNRDGLYSPRNPNSNYFGKIGRNTPIRIPIPLVTDAFGRSVSNGWGSTDTTDAWLTDGGAASDYSVSSNEGHISQGSINVIRSVYLDGVLEDDVVISCKVSPNVVALGAQIDIGLIARRIDSSNFYSGRIVFGTSTNCWVEIYKHVAGVETFIASSLLESQNDFFVYGASTQVFIEFIVVGSYLSVRAYDVSNPTVFAQTSVNNSSLPQAGSIGVMGVLETSNTNTLPAVIDFDDFRQDDIRCTAEAVAWPPRWDMTGTDIWVPMQALGIMSRLTDGAQNLFSCYRRFILNGGPPTVNNEDPIDYWPLEDSAGSTQAVNLFGTSPGQAIGDFQFANAAGPDGSDSLPSIAASGLPNSVIRCYPSLHNFDDVGDLWKVMFLLKGEGTDASCAPMVIAVHGDIPTWRLTVENIGTPAVTLTVTDTSNVVQALVSVAKDVLDGEWHMIMIYAFRNSSTTTQIFLRIDGDDALLSDFDTASGFTSGPVNHFQIPSVISQVNISSLQIGHLQFYNENNISELFEQEHLIAAAGFAGELVAERIERLCEEEGIPFALIGNSDDTLPMGPQRIATLISLLFDGADLDAGILYEAMQFPGLIYRTRMNLYNQSPTLTLDYAAPASHLSEVPEITDDKENIRNDVTVQRLNGSSERAVLDDGSALSISPPPVGIGTYAEQITLVAHTDDQLFDLAGWRLFLQTWDEARWPSLKVALHRKVFVDSKALTRSAKRVTLGDLIVIENSPAWLPPDDVLLSAQGGTEVIGRFIHEVQWNSIPALPYSVGVIDSVATELQTAVDTDDVTWKIAPVGLSTLDGYPVARWSTDSSDYPLDWNVAGERVTVSAVANGTWTYVAAGAAATDANAAGTSTVAPAMPAGLAQFDLLLVKASIRNSGTGIPTTPAGYTRLPIYPASSNVQIFAKVAGSSESAPTISFTGGVVNATLVAQAAAWRPSNRIYSINDLVMHVAPVLNTSAQNIIYADCPVPEDNCLIIYSGWKQDDWTSVAAIAGATEIGEPSSTLGDDAGLVWDYVIQTTKADIAAGSFTVTGGAGAISRAGVMAIRIDTQTATVVRSVNGIVKSQIVGEDIKLFYPAIIGL